MAWAHLETEGYTILATNHRTPYGELDIVALKDEEVVFVEVKTRRSQRFGSPEESITPSKGEHLIASAQHYLQEHPELPAQWRVDLVSVVLDQQGRLLELRRLPHALSF